MALGKVAFAASAVAKTGDMKIATPTAILGIRGTTGVIEVPANAAAASPNDVAVKLYPDADGKVGRIEINGRDGARLGFLARLHRFRDPPRRRRTVCRRTHSNLAATSRARSGICRRLFASQNIGRKS